MLLTPGRLIGPDDPEEEESDAYVALVYGAPGSGKTTLAAGVVHLAPPTLLVDIDGGRKVLPQEWRAAGITYAPVRKGGAGWEDIQAAYGHAQGGKFNSVILDTLTIARDIVLAKVTAKKADADRDKFTLEDYSRAANRVIGLVRAWADLAHIHGMTVILTAHEVEASDELSGRKMWRPDLGGKTAGRVGAIADAVWRLTANDRGERILVTQPDARNAAKTRTRTGYTLDNLKLGAEAPTAQTSNIHKILNRIKEGDA